MFALFGNGADDLLVVIDDGAGDDAGVRAQQIGDQRRDLVRLDQLAHRQPGLGLSSQSSGASWKVFCTTCSPGVSIQPGATHCSGSGWSGRRWPYSWSG